MSNYVKLFGSILDSTIWKAKAPIRCVWITMLAMADRDGVVEAALPGLADRAKVPLGTAEKAVSLFMSPDPHSKTKDHEGRRIAEVPGGWRLLNFEAYRERQSVEDRKSKNAERQRRFRERQGARSPAPADPVTPPVTQSNAPLRSITPSDACCSVSGSGSDPSPVSELPDPDARSNRDATATVNGHSLKRIFALIREELIGGLPWATPSVVGGKDSAMAEVINADPGSRADIAPTMRLLFKLAKEGKAGDKSVEIVRNGSFAFGAWCSQFTALREQLHNVAPKQAAAAGPVYRKL